MVQVFGCGGEANGHAADRLVKTSPPRGRTRRRSGLLADLRTGCGNIDVGGGRRSWDLGIERQTARPEQVVLFNCQLL